jgi:hypothetical protein
MPMINVTGTVTLLRVHDVGSGYGPAADHLDAEVIFQLNSRPGDNNGRIDCTRRRGFRARQKERSSR